MKKQLLNITLCTIMLLAISYQAKSQNYLGLSKTEIQSRFKNKGIETTLSVRDDGMTYLWFFNENEDYQTYDLNSNNICWRSTVVFKEVIISELIQVFLSKGYVEYELGCYVNDEFKIKIDYLTKSSRWFTTVTYK
jgi:hypothetical protein